MFYYTEITRNRDPWPPGCRCPAGCSGAQPRWPRNRTESTSWPRPVGSRRDLEWNVNIVTLYLDCNESKGLAVDVTGQERDRTVEFEVATVASLGRHHMLLLVT